MTASTTRCFASLLELGRALALVLLLVLPVSPVQAEAKVRSVAIVSVEDGYVINADFDVDLNPRLIDALQRGVSLYFTVELAVEQPRWYWFDRSVAERTLQYRLAYHAITRSYRLSVGGLHRSFDSLDTAMRTITRVRNWHVFNHDEIDPGASYRAALRLRHQTELLPKPLTVTASGGREWNLATSWVRWEFSGEPRP